MLYRLYCGGGAYAPTVREAQKRAVERFGGYTLTYAHGGWTGPDRIIVREGVVVWEIVTSADKEKVKEFAQELKDLFRQDVVLVVGIETTDEWEV